MNSKLECARVGNNQLISRHVVLFSAETRLRLFDFFFFWVVVVVVGFLFGLNMGNGRVGAQCCSVSPVENAHAAPCGGIDSSNLERCVWA